MRRWVGGYSRFTLNIAVLFPVNWAPGEIFFFFRKMLRSSLLCLFLYNSKSFNGAIRPLCIASAVRNTTTIKEEHINHHLNIDCKWFITRGVTGVWGNKRILSWWSSRSLKLCEVQMGNLLISSCLCFVGSWLGQPLFCHKRMAWSLGKTDNGASVSHIVSNHVFARIKVRSLQTSYAEMKDKAVWLNAPRRTC